jgi:signal transduction histidine kinase
MRSTSPVLADAAHVLTDELLSQLQKLARVLAGQLDAIEKQYLDRLERADHDAKQRRALAFITLGAALRFVKAEEEKPLFAFLEQVEYNGRRLAKLNLHPSLVMKALAEYDRILEEALGASAARFGWAREQIHFCVVLTLNNSYFHVREAETAAHSELFHIEIESRSLKDLLGGSMAVLAHYCRADVAEVYLFDEPNDRWMPQMDTTLAVAPPAKNRKLLGKPFCSIATPKSRPNPAVLDASWHGRYETCWSMPLVNGRRLAGVMQFGFERSYEWLPREQDLLALVAERCLLGAEKVKLMQDLAESEEQVRQLASRMLQVEEVERRRISRELHDETGQSMLCIRLQLEMAEKVLESAKTPAEVTAGIHKIKEVREMTESTILEIRRLIAALSPAVLEQLGLAPGLRQLASRFQRAHGAQIYLRTGRLGPVPKQTESIVYRLVQECINNIGKHSNAENVNISVQSADQLLQLSVEDDGVGFCVEDAFNKRDSYGLAGLRERVALLGGVCIVESRPRLPVKASASTKAQKRRSLDPHDLWNSSASGTRIRIEIPIPMESPGSTSESAGLSARDSLSAASGAVITWQAG